MIDGLGGDDRKDATGDQAGDSSLAIVLDGIPESISSTAGLVTTMMPEAFEHGGKWVGVVTTLGFAVAFKIHTMD